MLEHPPSGCPAQYRHPANLWLLHKSAHTQHTCSFETQRYCSSKTTQIKNGFDAIERQKSSAQCQGAGA